MSKKDTQPNKSENLALDNEDVNCIYVDDTVRTHIKNVRSKSNFFDSEIKYQVTDDCIIFEKPTSMYNGETIKPKKSKNGWWLFQIEAEEVPMKKYDFEDESTEDCVIVYYR